MATFTPTYGAKGSKARRSTLNFRILLNGILT